MANGMCGGVFASPTGFAAVAASGGLSTVRRGFTLVELLVVIAIF